MVIFFFVRRGGFVNITMEQSIEPDAVGEEIAWHTYLHFWDLTFKQLHHLIRQPTIEPMEEETWQYLHPQIYLHAHFANEKIRTMFAEPYKQRNEILDTPYAHGQQYGCAQPNLEHDTR